AEVAPAAAAAEPLLGREAGPTDLERWFEALCHSLGATPKIRHSVGSEEHIQHMVAAGLGIALSGDRQPVAAGLAARPIADPGAMRKAVRAAVAGRPHGPGLAAFLKLRRARDWRAEPQPPAGDPAPPPKPRRRSPPAAG